MCGKGEKSLGLGMDLKVVGEGGSYFTSVQPKFVISNLPSLSVSYL